MNICQFSADLDEIRRRGVFLHMKKGYGVRFAFHAVFDPILAPVQGSNGVKWGLQGAKNSFSSYFLWFPCTLGILLFV